MSLLCIVYQGYERVTKRHLDLVVHIDIWFDYLLIGIFKYNAFGFIYLC